MNSAIIACKEPKQNWCKEYFSQINPYLLPILGKPIIEFYLDYCSLKGIKNVLILELDFDEELRDFINDGSRWGLNIKIGTFSEHESIAGILIKNSSFVKDDEVIFFDGYFFPLYNKNIIENNGAKESDESAEHAVKKKPIEAKFTLNNELIKLVGKSGEKPYQNEDCQPIEIESILQYWELNMDLLNGFCANLIMSGYNAEDYVYMGMNAIILPRTTLTAPLIMGNNVQIQTKASLGPNTIVGDTCMIDVQTNISNCIIFNKTYIGSYLNLKNKILNANTIINPINEIMVEFGDAAFSSAISQTQVRSFFFTCGKKVLSLILILILLLPRLFFCIIGTPESTMRKINILSTDGRKVRQYFCKKNTRDIWFFKLSLDKIPYLWLVLCGKMPIIGDSVLDGEDAIEIAKRYKTYNPSAFSYAESLGRKDNFEKFMDDMYYRHQRGLKSNLQLLLRFFVHRLFSNMSV